MSFTAQRVRRIFEKIEEDVKNVPEVILIKNSTEPHIDLTFFYLSGLESGVFEGCALAAYPDGEVVVYTSRLEEESAKKGSNGFKIVTFRDRSELGYHIRELGSKVKTVGVNSGELVYRDFLFLKDLLPDVNFVDVGRAVRMARLTKDEEEIRRIRVAAEISSKIWRYIPEFLREGVTEGEVRAHITYQLQKAGASSTAFNPIVSFGVNTAEPHYSEGDAELKRGDLVVVDFGAKYRRYCADMTRTVVFGRASNAQRRIYEVVLKANRLGVESIAAGVASSDVDRRVSSFIESCGFKGYITHSTGHALGLSVHDGGRLDSSSTLTLEEGMVFTVEPGVYIPGFGGVRIEDDVVVRRGGAEVLTSADRELLEV